MNMIFLLQKPASRCRIDRQGRFVIYAQMAGRDRRGKIRVKFLYLLSSKIGNR